MMRARWKTAAALLALLLVLGVCAGCQGERETEDGFPMGTLADRCFEKMQQLLDKKDTASFCKQSPEELMSSDAFRTRTTSLSAFFEESGAKRLAVYVCSGDGVLTLFDSEEHFPKSEEWYVTPLNWMQEKLLRGTGGITRYMSSYLGDDGEQVYEFYECWFSEDGKLVYLYVEGWNHG